MPSGVGADLQAARIGEIASANPLRSLRSDAEYIATVGEIDGRAMLVAHSYGSPVVTAAGPVVGNIVGLVFIAVLDEGDRALDICGRFVAVSCCPSCALPPSPT